MTEPVFSTEWSNQLTVHLDDEEAAAHWSRIQQRSEEDRFFFDSLRAAEYHWHFVQGMEALRMSLFVPGVSSLLNGIEASLRFTLHQLADGQKFDEEPSAYKLLSNNLLKGAHEAGMPVQDLAFPDEADFLAKIQAPKAASVEVVRVRNNVCHGNLYEYFVNLEDDRIFTPDTLRALSLKLLGISARWAMSLGEFRMERRLRHASSGPIPSMPPSLAALV